MLNFTAEQLQAINIIDNNVSVSAGAGSGKTRVLVERYVGIIKKKRAAANEILAITFTRKAAKEMRERIRTALYSILEEACFEEKTIWQEQLKLLDKAQISTIDGFCSKILRENPVEASLDPTFTIAEEFELEDFYHIELERYMQKMLEVGNIAFLELLQHYGRVRILKMLSNLVEKLPEIVKQGHFKETYEKILTEEFDEKKWALRNNVENLLAERTTIKGKHRAELDLLYEHIDEVLQAISVCNLEILDKYISSLSARNKQDAALVKETRELVAGLAMLPTDRLALTLIEYWEDFLGGLQNHFFERKNKLGLMGFADIQEKALELLTNYPQVLQKYRIRYRYVMVDEFQDTNDEQRKLVYLLAGGDSEKLLDKRLFVVGDAKQSIYRFRGADVSVFKKVRDDIANCQGENIILADNFRSTPNILNSCNCVFADLLGDSPKADVAFQALRANRSAATNPELLLIETEEGQEDQGKELEAKIIASKIKGLINDNKFQYRDIAVLVAAINKASSIAHALLEENIPYQIVDGKGFYEKQEIIDIMNLLEFLANSRKNLPLLGILRSPFFGINDITLTKLFANKKEEESLWEVIGRVQELKDVFALQQEKMLILALEKLNLLRIASKMTNLPELFKEIYDVLQVKTLLAAQEFGWEKLANVDKLRSLASEFAMQQAGSLRMFITRVKSLRATKAREAAISLQTDSNVVTIMTIHKSKGLEFPAVFLPALQATTMSDRDNMRYLPEIGLGIKVVNSDGELVESSVFNKIKALNKMLETEEKKRQLYVAMTRAEEYLVLSGLQGKADTKKADGAETWLATLTRVFADSSGNSQLVETVMLSAEDIKESTRSALLEKALVVQQKVYEQIECLEDYNNSNRNNFSASSLQDYFTCQRSFYYRYLAKMPENEELGIERIGSGSNSVVPPYLLGLVVHSTLEYITRLPVSEALNLALTEHVPKHLQKLMKTKAEMLVHNYLKSSLYAIVQQQQISAEEDFYLPLFELDGEKIWFQGSIDCLLKLEDGSLGIVDYKTGRPPAPSEEKYGYALQLAVYSLAAENIYGQKVTKAELHFLQNNTVWNSKQKREVLEEELKNVCLEIRNKKLEKDFTPTPKHCRYCGFSYFCPERKN